MTQVDFENILYENHCGTRAQCKEVVKSIFAEMFDRLDEGETVQLRGIGTLRKAKPRAVNGKLPSLANRKDVKQLPTIRFTPSRVARGGLTHDGE